VFLGSIMSSEKTAAAAGTVGELRFDPFAMLPFCGYNMADYFAHWLRMGRVPGAKLPKIFYVNWFRKDADGRFLWPGFGENSRVLAWIFARCAGHGAAARTPIGLIPPVGPEGIDTRGLGVSDEDIAGLLRVDVAEWNAALPHFHEHLAKFERLPRELRDQLNALERRLSE
jgi:phosphoenolpyruvate carboxykinase (GTP)